MSRINYQALIDTAHSAGSSAASVPLDTIRQAIDALRMVCLFNEQAEALPPAAQRYWLLTLSALEQARIWSEETIDKSSLDR